MADTYGVSLSACKKFTSLVKEDCTLPFIARYRKEMVGNLDIEVLRKMKSSLEDLQYTISDDMKSCTLFDF